MSKLAVLVLAAVAAASLTACATRPLDVSANARGDGRLKMESDGVIRVTVRSPDAFGMGKDGVVTFKPGDPFYELMREQAESGAASKHKPIFIWTIGEPEIVKPAPPQTAQSKPAQTTTAQAAIAPSAATP